MISGPEICFYCLLPGSTLPQRASRTLYGVMPLRAAQHCEPLAAAAGYGWHLFSPTTVGFMWDGNAILWSHGSLETWYPLSSAQYPGFVEEFNSAAPDPCLNLAPFFLNALPESGIVQVWSGCLVRTAKNWSCIIRAPVNFPQQSGYEVLEGIVETDWWFGPLFTNIRLTKTNVPIIIQKDQVLFQVQPVLRMQYNDEALKMRCCMGLNSLTPNDWRAYHQAVDKSGDKPSYAVQARKLANVKSDCTIGTSVQSVSTNRD